MGSTLIKGGTVLSLDRAVGNHLTADVLIDDGVIAEIGPSLRARGAEVIDAGGTIVMPGFVDAHHRVALSLLRSSGLADRDEGALSADDVYTGTLVGLLQALTAGATTVVDWSIGADDPASLAAARAAHVEAGVRTVLVVDTGRGGDSPGRSEAHRSPDVAPDAIDAIAADWAQARRRGCRIHARAGTAAADVGSVAELGRRGLLGPDITLAHCVHLSDADVDAISSSSTAVVLTPASDMAAGRGNPPMQQLIERGIRPGLGVGDVRLAPGDVFAQMRAAISVQHAVLFDLKLAGKGGIPNLLGTRDVIRYATVDGARAAGLGDVTGSLTPGRRADVVVLRADRPNIAPVNDPIGAVVWGMDTSNVDWVFVDGVARVANGELVVDAADVRLRASSAARRLAGAAGLGAMA
jgi:cytosine/adenosine deaminase-related metal-dependent hydrolase